jgi:outer membrane protein OmpA-like peptidoglycan-associated protein
MAIRWSFGVSALLLGLTLGCAPKPPPPQVAAAPQKKYEAPDERFVFFNSAKTDVLPEGLFAIGYVCAQLDNDTSYHVLIVGHADPHGKAETNRELSLKRARAVRKVLMEHGIKQQRILIAAPKESDSTSEQLSRRADLYVYDPVKDEASTRLGYKVDVKSE